MAATIWTGQLVFGLVSIPVRLFKAARRERVQFHNVYGAPNAPAAEKAISAPAQAPYQSSPPTNVRPFPTQQPSTDEPPAPEFVERLRQPLLRQESNTPLPREEILKAYEVEPDQYAVLKPSEITALRAPTSKNLEIAEFVSLDEIDRNYFDASYYVVPNRGGEKAYALFYRALAETGCVAVGELAMRGREYAVVIRPSRRGLVLHTLFFANEVRIEDEPAADLDLVNDKELSLAKMLVNAQKETFKAAKLKDKFKERVLEAVQERTRTAVANNAPNQVPGEAPVGDLMDALRKSLDAVRKPAQRETSGQSPKKKDQRRAK